jgi:hypothetical protein
MITVRRLKVKEYYRGKITLLELKEAMIRYYYPNMSDGQIKKEMDREMIITPIKNGYGNVYTTIYSINGSPPKGECIFIQKQDGSQKGDLIFLGIDKSSTAVKHINLEVQENV